MRDTILCLCDLTGVMARPWVEHGYQAVLVDPQHGCDHEDGAYLKLACTIEEGRAAYQAWLKEHDRQIAEKSMGRRVYPSRQEHESHARRGIARIHAKPISKGERMNEIQLTDHLVAHISAGSDYGRYQAKICEDGNFRNFLYAMSLKRLKRKCEKYAKRERKAIAYVTTLKEES